MTIQSTVANCWELSKKKTILNFYKAHLTICYFLFTCLLAFCLLTELVMRAGVLPLSLSSPHYLDHNRPLAGT